MARVHLNIADIGVALEIADPQAVERVGTVFKEFDTTLEPQVMLRIDWEPSAPLEHLGDQVLVPPTTRVEDGVLKTSWALFEGWYSLVDSQGEARVRGLEGLSRFLWLLMSTVLPSHGGLVVHASSVADERRAYMFPAPSGTGKSTVVKNSPHHHVLSDDGSLLRITRDGVMAYGSPFRSDNYQHFRYFRFPLHGLYFLEQAHFNAITPLEAMDALERLLTQVFLFTDNAGVRMQSFSVGETLLATLQNTCLLQLENSPAFWRCLNGEG